jgi:aflatoxin B1 aldehyde reductase
MLAIRPKPRVILGLMTFGPDANTGARITSLPEYKTCLDHFQAAGYNEIDTARLYVGGKQEAFTREAGWKDRGLTIATKVYPNQPGMHKAEVLTQHFNTSLKELGTDCVDIFYLHAAVCIMHQVKCKSLLIFVQDRSVPFAETLEAVDKLHKQYVYIYIALTLEIELIVTGGNSYGSGCRISQLSKLLK